MTNQEILTKAIEKAKKNGWDPDSPSSGLMMTTVEIDNIEHLVVCSYKQVIFDHGFARAFFKDQPTWDACDDGPADMGTRSTCLQAGWQNCLSKMVLYEDPIQYLAQFL